ncbi:MAG TPA: alpha/beta hydrolase [Methylomirabilota bacterium]|jgi:pimeloyl-ACP methyl ester carboxylesterase
MLRQGALLASVLVLVAATVAGAAPANLACDQEPGARLYWMERGFCDLEMNGPERAQGIIIWNHGINATTEQWRAPTPPAFRLLQARGWDVVILKRNNLGDANVDVALARTVERTLEEARLQRERGYRRVVLAGQSFGGYVTLEAASRSADIFAAVAMAPGVRPIGANGRLDTSVTERSLRRLKVERVGVIFPKDDALFGNVTRGESANHILAGRRVPYLLLDETSGLTGHAGGIGGRFALMYGLCLNEFLTAPTLPGTRFTCPPAEDWDAARELLMPNAAATGVVEDPGSVSGGLGAFTGRWYGLLEDTIVFFGLLESGNAPPRSLYRWAAFRIGGGIFDVALSENHLSVAFPNGAGIVVAPVGGEMVLTWTSADGTRIVKTVLAREKRPLTATRTTQDRR